MRVIVGLRNPGPEYEGTRHNIGSEIAFRLSREHPLKRGPLRVRMELARQGDTIVAVPMSFMNEVGGPVSALLKYFKASPSELLVIHDDIDLGFGRLRFQVGGGSGGHNGLRSTEKSLGTPDFARLKIGVGRPPGKLDPAVYVLRRFTKAERVEMDIVVEDGAEVALRWLEDAVAARDLAGSRRPGA
jgi:PTH1 family peptidyl-tRNA hydrolase